MCACYFVRAWYLCVCVCVFQTRTFVVEVEIEEGRAERVEALPVHVLGVAHHPRLEHALELAVRLGRRQ